MLIGELVAAIRADTSHLKRGLNDASNDIKNFSTKSSNSFKALESTIGSLKRQILSLVGIYGMQRLARSFVDAASTTEQFQIRLKFLLRSTEAANRTFKDMSEYAARVPHTYQSVLEAATRLSGVMKGGSEEINRWMPLIGDLAAATGHSLQITLGQIIRMYSAGAAAADLFREHGILSMLGFQYGVRYTAEETRRILFDSWARIDSQFRGAADELGKTWAGLMSMMSDRWFQFRNLLMKAGTFDLIKSYLDDIVIRIDDWTDTGQLKRFAETLGGTVVEALKIIEWTIKGIYNNWDELVTILKVFIAIKLGSYLARVALNLGLIYTSMKGLGGVLATLKLSTAAKWLIGLASGLGGIATAGGLAAGALYGAKKASDAYIESMQKWTITTPGYVPGKQSPLSAHLLGGYEAPIFNLPLGTAPAGMPYPRTGMTAMSGLAMSPTFGLGGSKSTIDLKAARETYKLWLETDKLAGRAYPSEPDIKNLKEYLEGQRELQRQWKNIANTIGDSFNNAIVDSLDNGLDSFKNFAESIKRLFLKLWADKAITQPLIMPLVNQMSGLFGFGGVNTGAIPGQQTPLPAHLAGGMASYAPYLGAGAMGYGLGGIGGGIGAMGGMYAGTTLLTSSLGAAAGPIGMIAGGTAGSLLFDEFFGDKGPSIEEVSKSKIFGNIRTSLSQALGEGFKDVLETGDYQVFEDSLKLSLKSIVIDSLTSAFISKAIDPLMDLLAPALYELSTSRIDLSSIDWGEVTGLGGKTVNVAMRQRSSRQMATPPGYIPPGFDIPINIPSVPVDPAAVVSAMPTSEELNSALASIIDIMKPFLGLLDEIISQLGLNTEAIDNNTSSIMGPVNDFLMSLDTGPLAASESLAGIADMANNLYTKALADPAQFSAYANFMTSTFLPLQQGISPDYAGVVSGVRGQVESIPYVQEEREQERRLLLDIKEAIENNPPVVIIDGEVIGEAAKKKIGEDSEFLGQLGSTIGNMFSGFKNIFS